MVEAPEPLGKGPVDSYADAYHLGVAGETTWKDYLKSYPVFDGI